MLNQFKVSKQAEITTLLQQQQSGNLLEIFQGTRPSFTGSLRAKKIEIGAAVIAEYKRASPSAGDINTTLSPEDAARFYADAGAGAISVLTEEKYFKGNLSFLHHMTAPGLPLLRKDFIFHPLQVHLTASTPASAMLVIVRTVDDDTLKTLIDSCSQFGLEAVVEIFNLKDLQRAQRAGATIIQVNSRDLDTLKVDHSMTVTLIRHKQDSEFWICASGIATPLDLQQKLALGYDAALVGSSLMGSDQPGMALKKLLSNMCA